MEKSGHGGSWARIEAPQVTKLRQVVISGVALGRTSERLQFEFDNGGVGPGVLLGVYSVARWPGLSKVSDLTTGRVTQMGFQETKSPRHQESKTCRPIWRKA